MNYHLQHSERLELRPNSESARLAQQQCYNKALTSPLQTRTVFKEDNEMHMYGLKICLGLSIPNMWSLV